jgi:hypothetical protein
VEKLYDLFSAGSGGILWSPLSVLIRAISAQPASTGFPQQAFRLWKSRSQHFFFVRKSLCSIDLFPVEKKTRKLRLHDPAACPNIFINKKRQVNKERRYPVIEIDGRENHAGLGHG